MGAWSMFKRSANSGRMRGLRAGIFAVAIGMPGFAFAEPAAPLLMDPAYAERATVTPVAGCEIVIAALTDNRRSPETVGIIAGFRSISAPADREAWFRSVIETGLRERGFTPTYAPAPLEIAAPEPTAEAITTEAAPTEIAATGTESVAPTVAPAPPAPAGPDVLTVRIRLQSVWLASLGMNKTGSVVLHLSAAHGAQSREGYYRGELVAANWNNGRGEFNEHMDRTFAEALNAMVVDLAPMCGGAS
jgi:hypothetical protein